MIIMLVCSGTLHANPILTEIYYNGPTPGSDPDEFIELSNPTDRVLELAGWRFTDGISYAFDEAQIMTAGGSLVLAKDPTGFSLVFPGFTDTLLDFAGALSNSGETIALADASGAQVWALRYDDSSPWPSNADGTGDSLQLLSTAPDMGVITNWRANSPTPGRWITSTGNATTLPIPSSLALLCLGALLLRFRRRHPLTMSSVKQTSLKEAEATGM
ncbi:lamin tail domain-containing protein [Congregibacter sp.]|uniref:lamin tail domain-containing protein n=1 Tax=Congregibacter sp. TaxID=2744308 RepID=UPI003F6A9609